MERFVDADCCLRLSPGGPALWQKFVYCVFQEAMRNDIPVDAPARAHVWPVMSDSVNTLGEELK